MGSPARMMTMSRTRGTWTLSALVALAAACSSAATPGESTRAGSAAVAAPDAGGCSGALSFAPGQVYMSVSSSPYSFVYSVATGDLDRDGHADIVVANYEADTLTILNGRGDGKFVQGTAFATGSRPQSPVVADLNGDGNEDILWANSQGWSLGVLLNDGAGGFTAAPSPAVPNTPAYTAVHDFDGDGVPDSPSASSPAARSPS